MGRRQFCGNNFSENGWPYVDQGSCTWIVVPGTNPPVRLQIQNGPPVPIMGAFAADYNAYVERLRDGDSACWTPGNSVATSNHPGGTAMDLNWDGPDGHTFRYGIPIERAYPGDEARNVRELLDFYEDLIFCGGFWSILDWMHFQMGGGTYDRDADRPHPKCQDFISRKIRADGFSTFRRGGTPSPPTPPPADSAAILAKATSITLAKAADILPRVSFALTKGNCTNPRRIAAALAQWVIESGHFVYTEEIASGPETQERWKYKGRTWIQLTWLANYLGFSQWCHSLGLVPSPTYFGDRPRELAEEKWAALGPAYWWAIKYPQINDYADRGDIDNVSKWVNAPAWVDNPNKHANGEAERRAVYNQALALGDQLLALIGTSEPPSSGKGFLMALSDQEQRALYDAIMRPRKSRSPFRPLGQGPIGSLADYVLWIDGSEHFQSVVEGARLGHPGSVALLREIAEADLTRYPDRREDQVLARNVLNEIAAAASTAPAATVAVARQFPTPIAMRAALPPPSEPEPQPEPEVLPAVQRYAEPAMLSHTPQELLDELDRLAVFDTEYQEKFDNLTKRLKKPEEPK